VYGGSGVGNLGGVEAVAEPWHGRPASAILQLPPQGVIWLVHSEKPDSPENPVSSASLESSED
jgi:1,4-alpha-glucan branching enzyme